MEPISLIKEYAKKKLTEVTAHDFYHSLRVMEIASYIGKKMKADVEIIEVASLVHDVIDKKVAYDVEQSKSDLKEFLLSLDYTNDQVNHVFDIILNMSYSTGRIPTSIEGKIVQDADRLEAVGAIAIARTFAYGGSKGRIIYEEGNKESGIQHFYDKLLLIKDKMNTEIGKELAMRRHEMLELFLKQFYIEWNLEDLT